MDSSKQADICQHATHMPENNAIHAPWEAPTLYPCTLETPSLADSKDADIIYILMDAVTFDYCILHLDRNKQPGPGGIPTINSLPGMLKEANTTIQPWFVLMWIMGETPNYWRTSNISMLYKIMKHCN